MELCHLDFAQDTLRSIRYNLSSDPEPGLLGQCRNCIEKAENCGVLNLPPFLTGSELRCPPPLNVWSAVGGQRVLPISLFCSNISFLAADPGYFPKHQMKEPRHTHYQGTEFFLLSRRCVGSFVRFTDTDTHWTGPSSHPPTWLRVLILPTKRGSKNTHPHPVSSALSTGNTPPPPTLLLPALLPLGKPWQSVSTRTPEHTQRCL